MAPRNKPETRRRQTFFPRLEVLEDRRVPTLTIAASPVGMPGKPVIPGTPVMLVINNASSSSSSTTNVTITDDGKGDVTVTSSTVSTVDTGKGDTTATTAGPTLKAANVAVIDYLASPGTDNFNYRMTNPATQLTEKMDVEIFLPVTPPPLPLKGNKAFSATFGLLATPFVPATAGTGAKAGVPAAHVDVMGHLIIDIHGTPAADNASLVYAGRVTGRLDVIYDDGPAGTMSNEDGDKISYSVQLTKGSTGQVFPRMTGGPGPDLLTLLVQKRVASDTVHVHGNRVLNGGLSGTGLNQCVSLLPITEINC
jgi:hypothetical protein